LSAKLLRAITEQGYDTPSPIQSQAIPIMLAGHDLLATAQTGTGKTASFVLPMLDRLAIAPREKGASRRIRALILTPTRELAAQVEQHIRTLGAYAGFVSATVYGGVSIRNQIQVLQRGVDILVATPGRLLDHVQQKTVDLRHVEIFVLDEADRMLDMGFAPDVRRISTLLSSERQTVMFSATFSRETRALANATLRSPKTVEIGRTDRPVDLVSQEIYLTPQEQKSALLRHLIVSQSLEQVLVFTKTKHGADRLAVQLDRAGIRTDSIHGDKRQAQRTRALNRFKQDALQVLVATDVAARGIDISALPAVINYDAPNTPEAYVHRIGRTGRAGVRGRAISLVTPAERGAYADVERHMQCKIERRTAEGFEAHASASVTVHTANDQPRRNAHPRRERAPVPARARGERPIAQGEPRRDRNKVVSEGHRAHSTEQPVELHDRTAAAPRHRAERSATANTVHREAGKRPSRRPLVREPSNDRTSASRRRAGSAELKPAREPRRAESTPVQPEAGNASPKRRAGFMSAIARLLNA